MPLHVYVHVLEYHPVPACDHKFRVRLERERHAAADGHPLAVEVEELGAEGRTGSALALEDDLLVVEDVALRDLGFKDYAPCRIEMEFDDDALGKLYDDLDEFEQMSYDPNDGSTDESYCREHKKELTAYYYLFQRED